MSNYEKLNLADFESQIIMPKDKLVGGKSSGIYLNKEIYQK